ncbi:amidohydrolase family protein [Streptomyces sp. NPDC047009]|uniref:amidohydrolase family protein n=1 Tax=unclassified Streptomyces TaxID=2593676 RepID=UPI0033E6AE79
MNAVPHRIDVHQHILPPFYRDALAAAGIADAGGRALPKWTPDAALELMDLLGTATAVVSVSTPGTGFLDKPSEAAGLARRLNDYAAALAVDHPGRFGHFATLPMPDTAAATAEAARALDELAADGVVLLANNHGSYLGSAGQDDLWPCLDERGTVVFVHPAELPAPPVDGTPRPPPTFCSTPPAPPTCSSATASCAATPESGSSSATSAASSPTPPTAWPPPSPARPAAASWTSWTTSAFYFDTALSSSPAALPTLLAFARPGHVLFGSDWPFAPTAAAQYFANGLDTTTLNPSALTAINRTTATALFPRLATTPAPRPQPAAVRLCHTVHRTAARMVFKLVQPGTNEGRRQDLGSSK